MGHFCEAVVELEAQHEQLAGVRNRDVFAWNL